MLRSLMARIQRVFPTSAWFPDSAALAAVFATSPSGLVMVQGEKVLRANPAFADLLGLPADSLSDLDIRDIFPGDLDLHSLELGMHAVVEGQASLHGFDGLGRRDLRLRICRVGGSTSRPLLLLGTEDMTDQRVSDRALRDHARRLRILSRQVLDVQEQERRNLARELHDEIGQQLTMVRLGLERVLSDPDTAGEDIGDVISQVAALTEQVRSLSLDLRPSMLDDLGLSATLRWYAGRTAKLAGLELHLDFQADFPRLPPELETGVFRIAQEAMNNLLKHARARRLDIRLAAIAHEVELQICDDGRGFDEGVARYRSDRGESAGLLGMQERAALIDARLEIESSPGNGCRVRLSLPIPPEDA